MSVVVLEHKNLSDGNGNTINVIMHRAQCRTDRLDSGCNCHYLIIMLVKDSLAELINFQEPEEAIKR